jgi:lysyl-tRNA synthetase class 2
MKIPVESTNISSVEYDQTAQTCDVEFNTGRTYRYSNMTPELFKAFMDAPSKGGYFAMNIRNVLPSKAID